MKISNLKHKINSWVVTAAVIAAVILVNVIVTSLDDKLGLKIDMTGSQQYEISQQTKDVMKSLPTDVKATVLGTEDSLSRVITAYMEKYENMSDRFNVEYIDVYKNQTILNEYRAKGENLQVGDIILTVGERYKVISSSAIYSDGYNLGDEQVYSFELEAKLTNGIVTVTGQMEEAAVYFLEGHNESPIETFPSIIKTQDYKCETANITNSEIPDDAKLLISIMPTADFSAEECEKIDAFLEKGGNLMVALYPTTDKNSLTKLRAYLAEWGITANNDVVFEMDASRIYENNAMVMSPEFAEHEVAGSIASQKLSFLVQQSISLDLNDDNIQKATTAPIFTSSEQSVAKNDLENLSVELTANDEFGPHNLAVTAERVGNVTSRVLVLGSPYVLETQLEGNYMFMENMITWLTNNQDNLKISPKVVTVGMVTNLSQMVYNILWIVFVWIVPLLILAVGIVIFIRRRYL